MKTINTLIKDIYSTVEKRDGWFTDELAKDFGQEVARRLQKQMSEEHHSVGKKREYLWFGELGPRCPKALWHKYNTPELAEPLPPWATIKYAYGHILEALVITLAKAAGHTVTGEQDAIHVDGVKGHRDCVIDGCIVDVKSASSFSFNKFKDGSISQNDSFGYLDQLDGYLVGSLSDPLVTVKDRAYLLAIDKTLGHMCLYEHRLREDSIRERIKHYREIVGRDTSPACQCGTIPDGKSGNIKLDVKASYNSFKHSCFPSLRTFLYASGPVYLTEVKRKPDVTEIDKTGKIVY